MYSSDTCCPEKHKMSRLSITDRGLAVGLLLAGVSKQEKMSNIKKFCRLLPPTVRQVLQRHLHNTRVLSSKVTSPEQQYLEQQKRNEEAGVLTELVRDFLDPAVFYQQLKNKGIDFYCGVPDSLLKDFCAYVTDVTPAENHVITANEGNAIGLAAGYHLATGKSAMVYLQNSGLGNTVNPLMSLAVPAVYSIPMLMLIGWRGEPGKRDEPQHLTQGKTTPGMLAALGIPFQPLPDYEEGAELVLQSARHYMDLSKGPYALLVKRQTFMPYRLTHSEDIEFPLNREEALIKVVESLGQKDIVVATTGMLSRELYEYRMKHNQGHERDFLTVGSMGHAASLALGIALKKPNRQVFCLDGDGSVLMHMGSLATVGQHGPPNLKHIIINNGAHDSVGGQPTVSGNHAGFLFGMIAQGCGYKEAFKAVTEEEITHAVEKLRSSSGPSMLEIKTRIGSRKNLGRPKTTPIENKEDFMHFLALKP